MSPRNALLTSEVMPVETNLHIHYVQYQYLVMIMLLVYIFTILEYTFSHYLECTLSIYKKNVRCKPVCRVTLAAAAYTQCSPLLIVSSLCLGLILCCSAQEHAVQVGGLGARGCRAAQARGRPSRLGLGKALHDVRTTHSPEDALLRTTRFQAVPGCTF